MIGVYVICLLLCGGWVVGVVYCDEVGVEYELYVEGGVILMVGVVMSLYLLLFLGIGLVDEL